MMQIRNTDNSFQNKIVVLLAIALGLFAIVVFASSCNSSRLKRTNESHTIRQDSTGSKDSARVVKSDSTAMQEENTFHYSTGDSSLDSELEIVMQQQKDYANGVDTEAVQPITIEKQDDKIIINPGKNKIERIRLKDKKQGSKKDSVVNQKSIAASLNKVDSSTVQQAATVHQKEKKKETKKEVEKKKVPWYLPVISIALAVTALAILIIRKKAKGVKKVTDIFS